MGKTLIEKILGSHAEREVSAGDIADVKIDVRVARDFGGANVVKNIRQSGLSVADPARTFFTFDCNPTGSDQNYAANQQACRQFARANNIGVYDIDRGIGTHLAIDNGLIGPGGTLVSTDSHANILGAIGAFGQGMGDVDIAAAFAHGSVWFEVPPSMKVVLKGTPSPAATAKDITLAMLRQFGANGLLGYSVEVTGPAAEKMSLPDRITLASMATEMGAIIILFAPSQEIVDYCRKAGAKCQPLYPDADAVYAKTVEVNIEDLGPLASRPGHPEDVVEIAKVQGTPIDSVIIGSCTNGRFEDLQAAANILKGRKAAPGLVLKIVPATDDIWKRCMAEGLFDIFKAAGAMIGNAGCAGCAAGQIGQNGPGEVTVSTGNRNFVGKQGKGEVYLVSPATAAASAVAGAIVPADAIPAMPVPRPVKKVAASAPKAVPAATASPAKIKGRVWIIDKDNIDTDMIYHNRYLTVTEMAEMGQYTFVALPGREDFAKKAKAGDIVIAGENFGCGSSRQQAVDCFKSLGVQLVIAKSFGAIYERNAINNAMPIMVADLIGKGIAEGDVIEVDLTSGKVTLENGEMLQGRKFSQVQMDIYRRGGLLAASR